MNLFAKINKIFNSIFQDLYSLTDSDLSNCLCSPTSQKFADKFQFSLNHTMVLSKKIGKTPQEIGNVVISKFKESDFAKSVQDIEFTGGFINLKLTNEFWTGFLDENCSNQEYGIANIGKSEKINVEYVSANPTGPMHIGHARGAVYGDIVANILQKCGYDVTREYYINDAGGQIDTVVDSLLFRVNQVLKNDFSENVPENCYPGEYLIDAAKVLVADFSTSWAKKYKFYKTSDIAQVSSIDINNTECIAAFEFEDYALIAFETQISAEKFQKNCQISLVEQKVCFENQLTIVFVKFNKYSQVLREFICEYMMNLIKQDLRKMGVVHDIFTSEAKLAKDGKIQHAFNYLQSQGLIYKGVLERPKFLEKTPTTLVDIISNQEFTTHSHDLSGKFELVIVKNNDFCSQIKDLSDISGFKEKFLKYFKREIAEFSAILRNSDKNIAIAFDENGVATKFASCADDLHIQSVDFINTNDEYPAVEQFLFKSKDFGDDEDRAVMKNNGSWSYFMPDIAYHYDKFKRGFNDMVLVLGVDHKGYKKRISAAVDAMSNNCAKISVILCELVNFIKDGKQLKMSKRAGNFLTVSDVLEQIDPQILRFFIIMKKNDTRIDFDMDKVLEQSSTNPIFYIQYAHTRCCSLLGKFSENSGAVDGNIHSKQVEILHKISQFPGLLEHVCNKREPHLIAQYLLDLAGLFHSLWNVSDFRFVNGDNSEVLNKKFVQFVKNNIANCLNLFGVTPIERM